MEDGQTTIGQMIQRKHEHNYGMQTVSQCQTRCVIGTIDRWEWGNKLARGKESGTMMEYGNSLWDSH